MATAKKKAAPKSKAKASTKKVTKKTSAKTVKKTASTAPKKVAKKAKATTKAPKAKTAKVKATKTKTPEVKKAPKKAVTKKASAKKAETVTTRIVAPSFVSTLDEEALPVRLQAVVDKSEITDVLYNISRGLDRIDETLLRSVFHPDATIDMGPGLFQGTGHDYVHWVMGVLGQIAESHHMIANARVTLEHDVAYVESYCHAHYRVDKPTGREDVFIGSRYLDRMERRPSSTLGVWKIVHRKQVIDWVRTEAVSDLFYHQNPDALWSYHSKPDLSYQMGQFPSSQTNQKVPAFLGHKYNSKSIKF